MKNKQLTIKSMYKHWNSLGVISKATYDVRKMISIVRMESSLFNGLSTLIKLTDSLAVSGKSFIRELWLIDGHPT